MTKKWRRVYAWVLTVAMVLSMANLPITIAKAASTPESYREERSNQCNDC